MKPRAPQLTPKTPQPSLHTEITRLCEAKATEGRPTIPAPPTAESLRAATPLPPDAPTMPPSTGPITTPTPAPTSAGAVTTPAPPPASDVIPTYEDDVESGLVMRPAIPPPPRVPKIVGG
jgi:hypothetical protein